MKVEAYVFLFIGAFFGLVAVGYWVFTHDFTHSTEYAGSFMLIGATCLGFFPGGYYFWWSRRMKPRAEDNPQATREDGAGVVAAFPSSSIWPFVLGLGAAFCGLGLVFGLWTATVGVPLIVTAVIGVVRESRRGGTI